MTISPEARRAARMILDLLIEHHAEEFGSCEISWSNDRSFVVYLRRYVRRTRADYRRVEMRRLLWPDLHADDLEDYIRGEVEVLTTGLARLEAEVKGR